MEKIRKVQKLYEEVLNIPEEKTISENIEERLDKTLKLYIKRLEDLSDGLFIHKQSSIYREVNK